MGIHSVAIYGDEDQASLHVQICEEAHRVDAGLLGEPYLNAEAIVETAKKAGAEAIHPGYGLLSENTAFARAVRAAGLSFVGPSAQALEMLSDELSAREVAKRAGVRTLPAVDFRGRSHEASLREVDLLGYPVAIKRSVYGGSARSQIAHDRQQLEEALAPYLDSGGSLAESYRVYVEKYIERHRCIEVEVAADESGNYIILGERECSVQLHDRKLVEESPAPALTGLFSGELKRATLCDCTIGIAQEAGFTNLGTAEFIVDADGQLFFRRFYARLQVGHQLTELCTGLNLVELQLRLASGELLPLEVRRAQSSGHAMQARISTVSSDCGEPIGDGKVRELRWPSVGRGKLKFETNLYVGAELNIERNPWLARAATYGATRHEAMLTLDRVLAETAIAPLATNVTLLREVLASECFRAGQYDVTFAEQLVTSAPEPPSTASLAR
jgi:acetyl-CoA carboxylase biotin carboxylase subunit/3-methylcrotonyl-CoA carboxylase alpha subunit